MSEALAESGLMLTVTPAMTFPAKRACFVSGLGGRDARTQIGCLKTHESRPGPRLQARKDLFGINASSQTVINTCELSRIGDSRAQTTKKQNGSDRLYENAGSNKWLESRSDRMNRAGSRGFDDDGNSVSHK
jgi:hypothetical protein